MPPHMGRHLTVPEIALDRVRSPCGVAPSEKEPLREAKLVEALVVHDHLFGCGASIASAPGAVKRAN